MILPNVSCVAIEGRAILISGASGAGKSSLALALIDRGAMLIGDDGVTLDLVAGDLVAGDLVAGDLVAGDQMIGTLVASPPPNISGLLEVRNVGLIKLQTTSAPVALSLELTATAPRLPEAAGSVNLCGVSIPRIALYPNTPALPLRAEWALLQHGTPRPKA